MNRNTKEQYIYEIILNFVNLEKYAWNNGAQVEDFKEIWKNLMQLSDSELEDLYKKIMEIYVQTYKKMTQTVANIKKQCNLELERSEKEDEENILKKINF